MVKTRIEPVHEFEGLFVLTPEVFEDVRGSFSEIFNLHELKEAGIDYNFVQENQIRSFRGALRGMHFQRTSPQAKLIRVTYGRMFDVVVDLRKGSPSLGKWFGIELNDKNGKQLLIPHGFAHGCLTLSEKALCIYLCDEFYAPDDECGFSWDDSAVSIHWPELGPTQTLADGTPLLLSEKDRHWPSLRF